MPCGAPLAPKVISCVNITNPVMWAADHTWPSISAQAKLFLGHFQATPRLFPAGQLLALYQNINDTQWRILSRVQL